MSHRDESRSSPFFRLAPLLALLLPACGTMRPQSIEVGPLTRGQLWRGVVEVAESFGFPSSGAGTDQGLGIYESQWRDAYVLQDRHPGRKRLHIELQPLAEGDQGWTVLYYVEQQRVDDPAILFARSEADWSRDGQDTGAEEAIGRALRLRLGVRAQQDGARDPDIR